MRDRLRLALLALSACQAVGCGPLALDSTCHVRGQVVAVDRDTVTLRHKSGRRVSLTVDERTRIGWGEEPATLADVCPAQRAHAVLRDGDGTRLASLRVSGPRCRQ